jgi:hypothetical protein
MAILRHMALASGLRKVSLSLAMVCSPIVARIAEAASVTTVFHA